MLRNPAIRFGVANQPEPEDDADTLVHDDYAAWLRQLSEGVADKDLEEVSGKSRQTLWRGKTAKRSERTIGAATALRDALVKVKDIELPPPAVSIRNGDDWEWYVVGRRLMAADHDKFLQVLEHAQTIATGAEAEHGLRELGNPQGSGSDATPPRWRTPKGSE